MKDAAGGILGAAAFSIAVALLLIVALAGVATSHLSPGTGLSAATAAGLLLLWRELAAQRAGEGAREQAEILRRVFAASESVLSSLDVNNVLRTAAEAGGRLSRHASAALLFLADEPDRAIFKRSWGIDPPPPQEARLPTLDIHVSEALRTRRSAVAALPAARLSLESAGLGAYQSACILPLQNRAGLVGVLVLLSHKTARAFRRELITLEYFATQAAMAIDNARLYQQVQDLFLSSVKALVAAVDAKDAYTHEHSEDLATLVSMIAREMKLPPREEEKARLGALVHDVGKIGIPDAILHKPGGLDPTERAIMMTHVEVGASIIDRPGPLQDLVAIVRHHHEHYDGRGYPDGLRGNAIPIGAAILAVADAFHAMTSHRVYRPARSVDAALEELKQHAGTQFHPQVVDALVTVVHRERTAHSDWSINLDRRIQDAAGAQKPMASSQPLTPGETELAWRLWQEVRQVEKLPDLLGRIVDLAAGLLGLPQNTIMLLDDDEQRLTVEASAGAPLARGTIIPRGRAPAWRAIEFHAAHRHRDGSAIFAPLISGGKAIGVVQAGGTAVGDREMRLLSIAADTVAPVIQAARLRARSERAAASDELTGLSNRRALVGRLHEEAARYRRYGARFALLLGDIRRLSQFNAQYGYQAGDELIRRTGEILSPNLRQVDLPARLDGGTFAVLMPELDAREAERAVRRFQAVFKDREVAIRGHFLSAQPLTWAVALCPHDGQDADTLLAMAERRLRTPRREPSHGRTS